MQYTISLKSPILTTGGTVIVLFHDVDPAHFDGSTHVAVDDEFSFVHFEQPKNARWSLTFVKDGSEGSTKEPAGTKLLSSGSGGYEDDKGATIKVDDFEVFHVLGPGVSEQQSYARGSTYSQYLAHPTTCQAFGSARVCVPTKKTLY